MTIISLVFDHPGIILFVLLVVLLVLWAFRENKNPPAHTPKFKTPFEQGAADTEARDKEYGWPLRHGQITDNHAASGIKMTRTNPDAKQTKPHPKPKRK